MPIKPLASAHQLLEHFTKSWHAFISEDDSRPIAMAFSGGVDSSVCLHLLINMLKTKNQLQRLTILHVNHGLHALADACALHCQQIAKQYGVAYRELLVQPNRDQPSLENQARIARYVAIDKHTHPRSIIVTAHHLDDQAATIIMNLVRGCGPNGLIGMPEYRTFGKDKNKTLFRPLLHANKSIMTMYGQRHRLAIFIDPTNTDTSIRRNTINHRVLPALESQWPNAVSQIVKSSKIICQNMIHNVNCTMNTELSHIFNIEILTTLNQTHAINALRQWLMAFEINPSFMQVSTLLSQVCHARYDRMAQLVIGKWIIRRYQNRLYLETNLSKNCPDQLPYHGKTISWGPTIIYPKHFTPHPDIKPQDRCHLAQRQGGERIKWLGRPSQSVKKLFQHYKIPPWQRACHPILYINSIPRALYLPQYHHENHIFELDHV